MAQADNSFLHVEGLRYEAGPHKTVVLDQINISLPIGSRCILVGPNGCGKSTLLRIFAGKHYVGPMGSANARVAKIFSRNIYHDPLLTPSIGYIAERWTSSGDIATRQLLKSEVDSYHRIPAEMHARLWALTTPGEGASHTPAYPVLDEDRINSLVRELQISLSWRYSRVSLGQQRRIQLTKGLLIPRPILLLDEATTQLDPPARRRLLEFVRLESERYRTSIVLATHLIHGLADWATHIACLNHDGTRLETHSMSDWIASRVLTGQSKNLLDSLHLWLRIQWEEHIQAALRSKAEGKPRYHPVELDWQYLTGGSRSDNLPGERNAPEVRREKERLTELVRAEVAARLEASEKSSS